MGWGVGEDKEGCFWPMGDPMHLAKWVPGRVYLDRRAACC